MTVTLTYDSTLSRVRISATGLAAADQALVERSLDQITWVTVRGGGAMAVSGGVMTLTLDDYEFAPDEVNYYRVRGVETGAITFVATGGGTTTGNNASLTPALPAGVIVGDLLLILAAIRNSGTGTVNTPSGWTVVRTFGNMTILGRRYAAVAADSPTVTFAGGVANADTLARMTAFRRAQIPATTGVDLLNPSAQDIPYPALTIPDDGQVVIDAAWKQDDYSSLTFRAGHTTIGGATSTAGDDASMSWSYQIQTTATDQVVGTHVVTGGGAAISRTMTIALEHAEFLNEQTATIVPSLAEDCGDDVVWLKSIARPFLNRQVAVIFKPDVDVTRPARAGVFNVVGRTFPVAVNTVRGSRRWTMFVRTYTAAEADELDLMLASGDTLLVQGPADCVLETGYVTVGDATNTRHPLRPLKRLWELPMVEVAQPGPDVVGALGTWQTVLNTYATWADVIAANLTWADLLTLVGDPSEVIVP